MVKQKSRISKSSKPETKLLKMPVTDAVEILLFIMFLAAVLGAIFREKFVYTVFAIIVLLMIYEGYHRKKERIMIEKKFDAVMLKKRRQAGL